MEILDLPDPLDNSSPSVLVSQIRPELAVFPPLLPVLSVQLLLVTLPSCTPCPYPFAVGSVAHTLLYFSFPLPVLHARPVISVLHKE